MSAKNLPRQNTIAIVYDFDGTLSPDNMQERTIFEDYGLDKDKFWKRSQALTRDEGYERTLAYLKLLISDPVFVKRPLDPKRLAELAKNKIKYFNGVETYFDRLNAFLKEIPEAVERGITIEHYVISSGLMEILSGCTIAHRFRKAYACEFAYENGRPVFPKLVINDTNKTQFLFRINKGRLDLTEDINTHMPDEERPIPFRNMIYIGDGATDIPSMTLTQKAGGQAIAVFDKNIGVSEEVKEMVSAGRADHFAEADYSEGSLLIKILKTAIRKIIYDIHYRASAKRSLDWVKKNKK
jgi:2-hydroxy-3-keto-5-methylthiopentenyl-1-phosphate phosphatase